MASSPSPTGCGPGGHAVHTPDLFDGERLATIDDGYHLP